jgi:hypothetical protein
MLVLLYLLAAFGLAFGFQNRMPFLHVWAAGEGWGRRVLAKLLDCTFCSGFWAGWLTWAASWGVHGHPIVEQGVPPEWALWARPLGGLVWAFASAGSCYVLNAALERLGDS